MLHSLFGSNRPLVLAVLVVPAIAVGALAFFHLPEPSLASGGPLFDLLQGFVQPYPVLRIVLGLGLIMANAILINGISNRHAFSNSEHFFPALVYFALSISDISWVEFNPIQSGNLLVLLSLRRLLTVYRVTTPASMLYDSGLFLGIGLLVFPLLVFVLPILWLGIKQLRSFNLREWIIPVIGVLTVAFYGIIAHWWFGYEFSIDEFTTLQPGSATLDGIAWNVSDYLFAFFTMALFILGLLRFVSDMNISTVHRKNSKAVFLWFTLLVVVMVMYASRLESDISGILAVLGPSLAVFCGIFFLGNKRPALVRWSFYLWLVLAFVHLYFTL